jgi:hypothetical protein
MEKFDPKRLNNVKGTEKCQIKILSRFIALENFNVNVDINMAGKVFERI